uniref:Tudor domain-containing protein Tdr24 n=1 Tax=Locusta migratoria TaxID=7004 RepID=A0AAU7J8K0_LOCMI
MSPKSNVRNGRSNERAAGNSNGVVLVSSDYIPAPYPEDVVNHRHIIIHEELPDNVLYSAELQVYVRKVNSPSEFWINLCGSDYSRKLVDLYADMRQFYQQKQDRYLLPNYAVLVGQFCVCSHINEWHRARIVNASDKELVDVFLIDCGGTVTVSTNNLRYMHKQFSYLPVQSFLANLPDIKPRSGADWSTSVCEFFHQETAGKKLFAKVLNVATEKHTVSLKLLDASRNSISDKLISNNMARAKGKGFDAPAMRNGGSLVSSLGASSLKVDNTDTSSRSEDNSTLPESDEAVSRGSDAPVTCNTWRNVYHNDVTVAGKKLLLLTVEDKNYFVLSEFLQAFSVLHEHVVLKLLETFPSRVVVEKMADRQLTALLRRSVKGRRIRGLAHLADRGVDPRVRLLPVGAACQLLAFLGADGSQRISLHNFVCSWAAGASF